MPSPASRPPPEICPACGAEVPEKALACPDCGADYETGWNEQATACDGIDLPDPEFDYDAYIKREFGNSAPRPAGAKKAWSAAIIMTVVCVGILLLWWWL